MPILDPLSTNVSRPMVLLRLGYRRPSQVPGKTASLIDEVMEKGRSLLAPKAVYEEVDVDASEEGIVRIGATLGTASASLRERLAGCRRAVLFAATIGPAIDAWAHELMGSGQMTRGLLADAYGSSAAIALGLAVEQVVERRFAERGLTATKRYAPGYGDWALADQAPLLALLDVSRIGITLTEDSLMIPAKSISGVIGGLPAPKATGPATG